MSVAPISDLAGTAASSASQPQTADALQSTPQQNAGDGGTNQTSTALSPMAQQTLAGQNPNSNLEGLSLAPDGNGNLTPVEAAPPMAPAGAGSPPGPSTPGTSNDPMLTVHGNVSQMAIDQAESAIQSLPPNVKGYLQAKGVKVGIGTTLENVFPQDAQQQLRGWPQGSTEVDDDGMYDPATKTAGVAELHFGYADGTDNGITALHADTRIAGTARHELGHAFDDTTGLSGSRDFMDAYNADVANLSQDQKNQLAYYLQSGGAGRQETAAEVFGALNGGGGGDPGLILGAFPSVAKVVQNKMNSTLVPPVPVPLPPAGT